MPNRVCLIGQAGLSHGLAMRWEDIVCRGARMELGQQFPLADAMLRDDVDQPGDGCGYKTIDIAMPQNH